MTDAQRAAVIKEAQSWAGTPYRGWTCLKGVGADCGQLIYGVYRMCGLIPLMDLPRDYSIQSQHRASTEYMDLIDRFFDAVPEADAKPGDLVCYRIGPSMAHAAIIISWPTFVMQAEQRHGVSGSHGLNNPGLRARHYLRGTAREFRTLRGQSK